MDSTNRKAEFAKFNICSRCSGGTFVWGRKYFSNVTEEDMKNLRLYHRWDFMRDMQDEFMVLLKMLRTLEREIKKKFKK